MALNLNEFLNLLQKFCIYVRIEDVSNDEDFYSL